MTDRIYKYAVVVNDEAMATAKMPATARVIHVGTQEGGLFLWAIVHPQAPHEDHTFAIVGTGWDMPENCSAENYVGTVHVGSFVWHIFNLTDNRAISGEANDR